MAKKKEKTSGRDANGRPCRSCHKCVYNGRTDDDAKAACVACPGPSDEPTHAGASHVSMDAMPDGGASLMRQRLDTTGEPPRIDLPQEAADAVRRVMAFFMAMELDEFSLVKHLLGGGNLNTYALVNNIPRQYAWKRIRRMMERSPELRVIVKERKQPNGRVLKSQAGFAAQMSLF